MFKFDRLWYTSSMKKVMALTLALLLLGGSFAFACECCMPMQTNISSTQIKSSHSCCEVTKTQVDVCGTIETKHFSFPESLSLSHISSETVIQFKHQNHKDLSGEFTESPPHFSPVPLYLANLALRF